MRNLKSGESEVPFQLLCSCSLEPDHFLFSVLGGGGRPFY